jgi:hypothetical protein
MNTLGPSMLEWDFGSVIANEGRTVNNATRSFRMTAGARNANRESNSPVKERTGAR